MGVAKSQNILVSLSSSIKTANVMDNRKEFFKELHDLLEKYQVEISVGLEGDTHGLQSWIDISHRPDPKSCKYVTVLTLDELTHHDLTPHFDFDLDGNII